MATVEFDAIESAKENVMPSADGYSAASLSKVFAQTSFDRQEEKQAKRHAFEQEVADSSDDSDDPLEVWTRYINWVREAYPQGHTTESGLITLVERCTRHFLSYPQYKDDPRYLRLFILYARYFDAPVDIYLFLEMNQIGLSLALYYEEYAGLMEMQGRFGKAESVYLMGLSKEARPVERLRRKYNEFKARMQVLPQGVEEPASPKRRAVRTVLGQAVNDVQQPQAAAVANSSSRIQIFADPDGDAKADAAPWEAIGTLRERRKENAQEAKQWKGEILPMAGSRPVESGERLQIYKDQVIVSCVLTVVLTVAYYRLSLRYLEDRQARCLLKARNVQSISMRYILFPAKNFVLKS